MTTLNASTQHSKDSSAKRLFKLIIPDKAWIFFSVLCMGGYTLFNTAPAVYIKDVVDSLAHKESPEIEKFFLVGAAILVIFSMKGLFYFGQSYSMGLIAQRLLAKIRAQLFQHLQGLSLSFFSKAKTGDLISRFTNDLQVLQTTLQITVTGPFRDIPQIFVLLGVMWYRSWQLAAFTFILMPIALFFIRLFGRMNKRITNERQNSFGELTSLLVENISGMKVVKAFGMEKYEVDRFEVANQELHQNYMRSIKISAYASPVIECIGATAGASIVAYGGYLIINDIITPGDFASFFVSFFMMNEPVKKLNGFNLKLQEGLAAIRRVFVVMDTQSDIQEHPDAVELKEFKEGVSVHINSFHYQGVEEPALADIHLDVKKGEIIALVGSSGSGKTSLVNMVPRFYDVEDGNITIDGHNLKEIKIASLRSLISIVTQETILFNDSIANNISYGDPECSEERIIAAAKAANAHQFILEQPQGYQTMIGERGVRLSGGQRQRLSIARALVKDAPILILDEATSALDSEAEVEVQQAIEHLMEHRTTFVIAHRLSTIRHADRICVMEKGRIIELGTHDELLEKNGRYSELHSIQFN